MSILDMQDPLMLFCLKQILLQASPENASQKAALCHWVFQLHAIRFPKSRRSFRTFLTDFGSCLHEQTVYRRLRELNFGEGMLHFATVRHDVKREVELSLEVGDYANVVAHLKDIKDHREFVQIVRTLLSNGVREQTKRELEQCWSRPIELLVPVLVEIPEVVCTLWKNHAIGILTPTISTLLIVAFSKLASDDGMISILDSGVSQMQALRFCQQYECTRMISRILILLGRPEAAVDASYRHLGVGYVHSLLSEIEVENVQKRGMLRLLTIESSEDRAITLALLEGTNIVTFEEIIEFIDDEAAVASVEDDFMEFVGKIEETALIGHYQRDFPDEPASSFVIALDDTCGICHEPVMGRAFVRFPCNHMVHSECMTARLVAIAEHIPDRKLNITESCPLCGFLCVSSAIDPFNDSLLQRT
jgi:hypothetical protein